MLITFVALYIALTITIGLVAARRVKNSTDYLVAGRSLPLYMNVATVFATWFGAETVLSVSATFAKDGLNGIPGDPFGASLCLVLAALLFAKLFYRMNLLTIGDFYKQRYGKPVEVLTSVSIVISYLGWTSAQMTALGLVIHVLTGGAVELDQAIMAGAAVVMIYTIFGGMWSVAFTDLFQTVVILIGLTLVGLLVGDLAGGVDKVLGQALADGKLNMFPDTMDAAAWWAMAGAFLAFAFGSIPQQDVFQRMTSAKDEKTAVRGTIIGALVYFCFAFVPVYIAYAALVADPSLGGLFADEDARVIQRILPDLVLGKMPLWAQVMFFGALLSAILSTASGALLAPTALFTENVLKPFVPHMGDRQMPADPAHHPGHLHRRGADLCGQQHQHDVRDGAERLQRDTDRRLRAADRRRLLEARQDAGRPVLDHPGRRNLDGGQHDRTRRDGAAEPGRPVRLDRRHGARHAGADDPARPRPVDRVGLGPRQASAWAARPPLGVGRVRRPAKARQL